MAPARRPLAERLWAKIDVRGPDDCWLWTASTHGGGYGQLTEGGRKGRMLTAHRVVYELTVGPIPAEHEIDHLCEVPACCNPRHLEAVTHAVNLERSYGKRMHCPQGHPLDGLMRVRDRRRGTVRLTRYCLTCNRPDRHRKPRVR